MTETVLDLVQPRLDTRGVPVNDPGEITYTLNQWADVITGEFGISDADWDRFRKAQAQSRRVQRYFKRWEGDTKPSREVAASKLAAAATPTEALDIIRAFVRPSNDDEREAGRDLLRRAQLNAEREELAAFRAMGPALYAELQRLYSESLDATYAAAAEIPPGTRYLEAAARSNRSEQWLTLERGKTRRERMLALACAFYRWGVVKHTGRRPLKEISPTELAFEDPQEAADIHAVRRGTNTLDKVGGPLLFDAYLNKAAGGKLRTTSEVTGPLNVDHTQEQVRQIVRRLTGVLLEGGRG